MRCWKCGGKVEEEVIAQYESWGERGDKRGNKAGYRMHLEFTHHFREDKICQKCVNEKIHEFALAVAKDTKA